MKISGLIVGLFIASSAFCGDILRRPIVETIRNASCTKSFCVKMSERTWRHIIWGEAGSFGGHCFSHFDKKRAQKIFFDTHPRVKSYIVSSPECDDLPTLIRHVTKNNGAKIHTIFPPNVLDKEFVLNAFEKAQKEGFIDKKTRQFFTNFKNFQVAGYFKITEKVDETEVEILTIYPDLFWFRRRPFLREGSNHTFCASRFLVWNTEEGIWERQEPAQCDAQELDEDCTFWPMPRRDLIYEPTQ